MENLNALGSLDKLKMNKAQSGQEVIHLQNEFEILKTEMGTLTGKFATLLKGLEGVVGNQENELRRLTDAFRKQETEIAQKNEELKRKSIEVNDMMRSVNKDRALDINKRLSEMIQLLVTLD